MTEVHRQHVEWHDPSCSSLDIIQTPTFVTCLSCGSSGPPPPPALHLPLPDDSSIRLLVLLSGDFDNPIKCHLRVCSLSSKSVFSAISYTWADENGDETKCEEIILDGQAFQVSRNCHMTLKRVRQVTHTAAIWIDAICIDQYNTEERGHQVKLMSQIYLQAQKVFVYIGEHESGSRELLDTIGQVYQSRNDNQTRKSVELVSESAWDSLFARRYFSRLWVLQELALAKHAVILCGDSSLTWDRFANHSRLVKKFHNLKENPIFMFERSLFLSPKKELLLLDLGRRAYATDPRDKVYGLLGLMPAKRLGSIVADYTLSVEQLYVKVALEIAKVYGWKAVLNRAGTKRRLISSLPSWVPDWSFTGEDQMETPNLELLQTDVVDKNDIELKLIKDPGDDGKCILLDESKSPLKAYFFFGFKSEFFKYLSSPIAVRNWSKYEMNPLSARERMLRSTNQRLYLSPTAQPSSENMAKLLCTKMGFENVQMELVCPTDAIEVFPLTIEQLKICANDEYTLRLKEATNVEADESPSSVHETLWDEYFRLCAEGPVEDWVLEAEELWVLEAERLRVLEAHHNWERSRDLIRKREIYDLDGELYTANDAFWRLLIRRFALREQVVHIA